MPTVDLVDETYVAVAPEVLAPRITAPSLLAEWFPRLVFDVFMERGEKGTRWSVSGELEGSMEVWLEPMARGTLVHWFVRGEPTASARRDVLTSYVAEINARMFAFKDAAEADAATASRRQGRSEAASP